LGNSQLCHITVHPDFVANYLDTQWSAKKFSNLMHKLSDIF
jgi:hypothetical protein